MHFVIVNACKSFNKNQHEVVYATMRIKPDQLPYKTSKTDVDKGLRKDQIIHGNTTLRMYQRNTSTITETKHRFSLSV